jgi:FAD/FMN-containing dehydrogenase
MADLDRREFLQRAGVGAAALAVASELDLAQALADRLGSQQRVGTKALRELKRMVSGRVFLRGESGYGNARRVYNKRFDSLRPDAVVVVRNTGDVRAVMRWANQYDVNVRARSGGHSYAGYSSTDSGVVVDLSRLQSIQASNGKRSATVGAGVGLIRMYSKLAKKGLTVPGGSCPTVGISGLALGGGMGFASRTHGLSCDNITGVSIVTPDGKLREVSKSNHPGLLWACQGGGGGNFGIVTDFTFKAHRVSSAAFYFASWPWSQASPALEAWQRLTDEATSALCPFFGLSTGSESPEVTSEGQFFGSEGDLRKALKPLTDVDGVRLRVGTKPYGELMKQWAGCAEERLKSCEQPNRVSFYGGSDYVEKALNSSGRNQMIKTIEERQGQNGSGAILLDGYGGAINRVKSTRTAFVHRDQLYCVQYYDQVANKGEQKSASKWIQKTRRRLTKFVSGQAYQNYIDPKLKNWQNAYYGKNYDRLVAVKTKYDPDNRLAFRQGIRPS